MPQASAKEKLLAFLQARPAGADAAELVGLLFKGAGSDPELGARLIHGLIGGDPNFIFDADTGVWRLRQSAARASRSTTPASCRRSRNHRRARRPGTIIEIGAYRMDGQRITETFATLVRPHGGSALRHRPYLDHQRDGPRRAADRGCAACVSRFPGRRRDGRAQRARSTSFLDFEFRRCSESACAIRCCARCGCRAAFCLRSSAAGSTLLADHFGLSTEGRHRGLGDARMAAELLSIFLEMARGWASTGSIA